MGDSRLPKAVFYGELAKGKRLHGGQRLKYNNVVKRHLKAAHIDRRKHTRPTTVEANHTPKKESY